MNLADQLGITLRGVQTNAAKALRRFQPGGHTGAGTKVPATLRLPAAPKLSKSIPSRGVLPKLPPVSTSAIAGRTAAPHPGQPVSTIALGRGLRQTQANIRRR